MVVVEFTKSADKELKKLPAYISIKLQDWVEAVTQYGIEEVRKIKGYHDEPLQGVRNGQRSIRLSKAYRAIYIQTKDGTTKVLTVIEVNKHEY